MSNTNSKRVMDEQMKEDILDALQSELDMAVFEQDEPDVDKVKEILDKMDSCSPEEETKMADKEVVWNRIIAQSNEEFSEESYEKSSGEITERPLEQNRDKLMPRNRVYRWGLMAATILIAVFIGVNIGTYATEKKNFFEYVDDLANGAAFWVTGDSTGMNVEETMLEYYSWNDVEDEYRKFLMVPQGLPADMNLYNISVCINDTFDWSSIRYVDSEAKHSFVMNTTYYEGDEFTFANLLYEENYDIIEQVNINDTTVYYYRDENDELAAQCFVNHCIYMFSGELEEELLYDVIEKTLKF